MYYLGNQDPYEDEKRDEMGDKKAAISPKIIL